MSPLSRSNNIVSDRACWPFTNCGCGRSGLALPRGSARDGEMGGVVFISCSRDDYWLRDVRAEVMGCDLLVLLRRGCGGEARED
jgi:hypothetical protein